LKPRKYISIDNTTNTGLLEKIQAYCQKCYAINVLSLLQERIYQQHEPVAVDHELWRQCRRCGNLVFLSQLQREQKIKGFIEIDDNPLEQGSLTLASTGKRNLSKKKKGLTALDQYKKEAQRILTDYDNDSDIARMLQEGKQIQ